MLLMTTSFVCRLRAIVELSNLREVPVLFVAVVLMYVVYVCNSVIVGAVDLVY